MRAGVVRGSTVMVDVGIAGVMYYYGNKNAWISPGGVFYVTYHI